ncbi:hypothetical protein D3C76_578140 [compost metagenome]
MRVDAAYTDARPLDARLDQRRMTPLDGTLHQARLDLADRIDDADVRRDVNHPQLRRYQHHRDLVHVGQVGEQLGVAGVLVATGVQGFLVQRRGADRIYLPGLGQLHRTGDETVGSVPGDGRQHAERQVCRNHIKVDAVDDTLLVASLGRGLDPANLDLGLDDVAGLLQAPGIADHQRAALLVDHGVGQALDDDFRSDTGRIAQGDSNDGEIVAHVAFTLTQLMCVLCRSGGARRDRELAGCRRHPPW